MSAVLIWFFQTSFWHFILLWRGYAGVMFCERYLSTQLYFQVVRGTCLPNSISKSWEVLVYPIVFPSHERYLSTQFYFQVVRGTCLPNCISKSWEVLVNPIVFPSRERYLSTQLYFQVVRGTSLPNSISKSWEVLVYPILFPSRERYLSTKFYFQFYPTSTLRWNITCKSNFTSFCCSIFQYNLNLSLFSLNPIPTLSEYELMECKNENTNPCSCQEIHKYHRLCSLGVRWLGREAYNSCSSSIEVKHQLSYASNPQQVRKTFKRTTLQIRKKWNSFNYRLRQRGWLLGPWVPTSNTRWLLVYGQGTIHPR
jgi:hypothetical protein